MFGVSSFAETPFAAARSSGGQFFAFFCDEVLSVADTVTAPFTFNEFAVEPFISTAITSDNNIYIGTIVETLTSFESTTEQSTFLQEIAENSIPESQQLISADFATSAIENIDITETLVPYFAAKQDRVEPFTMEDVLEVTAQLFFTLTEGTTEASQESITAQFAVDRAENVGMLDITQVISNFLATRDENVTLDDIRNAAHAYSFIITENLDIADINSVVTQFNLSLTENTALSDASSVAAQFKASIVETFRILDIMYPRGWIKIDDSQTASWAAISDSQTPNWVDVNDSQAGSWVLVDDNQ